MNGSSAKYLLGEGVRSMRENRQMSIASVGVLMACMLLIGAAVLFSVNMNALMGYVKNQNEIVAYVDLNATIEQIASLETQIEDMDNISSYVYISKEQALEESMQDLGSSAYLLDGLIDDNPLPASFRIKVRDLERLTETVAALEETPLVYQVNAATDVVTVLLDISKGVNTGGLVIVAILAAVSILIIANTIKVTVFNRRREISIMKYVGATDAFIRIPFLVEGVIIGMISAVLAFGLLWVAYEYVLNWLGGSQSSWLLMVLESMVPFGSIAFPMLGGFAGSGAAFGLIGSLFFLRRYLKV